MSDRNTTLILPGHIPPAEIVSTLFKAPGVSRSDFEGDEAPRVGQGRRQGVPYTVLALRVFEVGGLLLMDRTEAPGPDDLEGYLGMALSAAYGRALFLHYNDEQGVGGHALYEGGLLTSRDVVDGRWDRPLVRDMKGEHVIEQVDPSDWVWPLIADRVEAGASRIFGAGVRTDDDIEALITGAAPKVVAPGPAPSATRSAAPAEEPAQDGKRARKRDMLKGLVKGWLGR